MLKVAPVAPRRARRRRRAGWPRSSTAPLPDGWQEELDAKAGRWKLALHRRAQRALAEPDAEEHPSDEALAAADDSGLTADDVELSPEGQAELERPRRRRRGRRALAAAVRARAPEVKVGGSHLRRLFWTRPLTDRATSPRAAERIGEHDEDRALLDSAVKANDGFFTTFFVSPVLEVHRALGGAPRLDAERRHDALGGDRLRRPPPRSRPASAGA